MTNKINCSKRPEVGHTWLQWIKNSKQEIQNKSPTKKPPNKTTPIQTARQHLCRTRKTVFLMHLWLELIKKKKRENSSFIFTRAYLLLKIANYKQLQKSKKINCSYHISKNSNKVWLSWLATLHIPVGKVKSTRSGSHIFQTQSLKGTAHLFHHCFYSQFSVRFN